LFVIPCSMGCLCWSNKSNTPLGVMYWTTPITCMCTWKTEQKFHPQNGVEQQKRQVTRFWRPRRNKTR
jgi:hypothetical protein